MAKNGSKGVMSGASGGTEDSREGSDLTAGLAGEDIGQAHSRNANSPNCLQGVQEASHSVTEIKSLKVTNAELHREVVALQTMLKEKGEIERLQDSSAISVNRPLTYSSLVDVKR